MPQFHDIAGIIGVVLIIGTYLLLQIGRINAGDIKYSALNAVGAAFIIFSLLFEFNMAAFIVEIFWLAVSLIGIGRWLGIRRRDIG